eukprot:s2467_g6.t4
MLRKSVICALACAGQSTIAWFLVPVRPVALRGAEMLPFTQVDSNCTTQPRLLQTPQTLDALSKLWVLVYLSTTRDNVYEHWSAVQSSCGCLTASRCERTVKVLLALRKESKDSSKSLIGAGAPWVPISALQAFRKEQLLSSLELRGWQLQWKVPVRLDSCLCGSDPMAAPLPLCVFAKPPRPGRAKTRLAASIGNDAACKLATAFINDFIFMASNLSWAYPVLATTEDGMEPSSFPSAAFPSDVHPASVPRWRQPDGDLGAKLEGIVRQGLELAEATICLGADSPGRPAQRLEDTRQALLKGYDAVLGPSEDGGYDLLALKRCPPGLLADLPWSQPTTFEATKKRLEEHGLRVAVLSKWWDVDEVEDLKRLQELLQDEEGKQRAPATAAVMAEVGGGLAT